MQTLIDLVYGLPEENTLKVLEKIPAFPPNLKIPKGVKERWKIRGLEEVHNKLIHKQYGIVALYPGFLRSGHIEMIRMTLNRKLNPENCFAIWRIDPPYKPITRHGSGKKLGGGKGNIDHYVTPVKANRVIVEVGGNVQMSEIYRVLLEVAEKLPFPALAVSQEMLDQFAKEKQAIKEQNINPYSWEYLIRNNIMNCVRYLGRYDVEFARYGPLVR